LNTAPRERAGPPSGAVPGPPSGTVPETLPSRTLPLLYLGFGRLSLAFAFAIAAVDPAGLGGFPCHPHAP
jgi:hypothetical protein